MPQPLEQGHRRSHRRRWLAFSLVVVITVLWWIFFIEPEAIFMTGKVSSTVADTAKTNPLLKAIWVVLRIVLLVYVLWSMLLFIFQDTIIFPTSAMPRFEMDKPEAAIVVWIENDEGKKVEGWYLPPREIEVGKPNPVVIFCHGNAEAIDFCWSDLEIYRRWGVGVFLPEYRGYGRSGGTPGQQRIAADMRKFYDWLTKRPDVDATRIFYHGRSVGGAIACQLAADHPPAALILQSTFTSISAMASRYYVPSFAIRHPFASDRVIAKLACPVFIAHGRDDTIIPVQHGRKLSQIAQNCVYYETAGGHNDFPMDGQFWKRVKAFLSDNRLIAGDAK